MTSWRPVSDDASLSRHCTDQLRQLADFASHNCSGWSLANGSAGVVVFLAHLRQSAICPVSDETISSHVQRLIEALESQPMQAGLYSGLSGVGWALNHLRHLRLPDKFVFELDEVDSLLQAKLATRGSDEFDLAAGVTGLGVYGLARVAEGGGAALIEVAARRLVSSAVQVSPGLAWAKPKKRDEMPDDIGPVDLGMAHGLPGPIALLSRIHQLEPSVEIAKVVEKAIDYLIAQQYGQPEVSPSQFGYFSGDRQFSRAAWCYGDAGIAAGLMQAGLCFRNDKWVNKAHNIATMCAKRTVQSAGVNDLGLCHGSSGLCHIFARLWNATKVPAYREAALYWLDITLSKLREQGGLFRSYNQQADSWNPDGSFITGAAGVGLALLAASKPVFPSWDDCLLLGAFPETTASSAK